MNEGKSGNPSDAIQQIGSSRTGVQTRAECNCLTAGSVRHSAGRGFNRLVGDFADKERFFIVVNSDRCIFHSPVPFVCVELKWILFAKCLLWKQTNAATLGTASITNEDVHRPRQVLLNFNLAKSVQST